MKLLGAFILVAILTLFGVASYDLTKSSKEFQIAERERILKIQVAEQKHLEKVESLAKDIRKVYYVPRDISKKIANAFIVYGNQYKVATKTLFKIAAQESQFNPRAINRATGDYGLMQINWFWNGRRFVNKPNELFNIDTNVEIACKILSNNRKMGYPEVGYYHSFDDNTAIAYEQKINRYAKYARNY